jgi:polysaccharide biosynthesis/export protein
MPGGMMKKTLALVLCLLAVGVTAVQADRYRVGAGDVLEIVVFEEEDASGTYIVSPKGDIQNNLLGTVHVENLTDGEIRDLLTRKFSEFIRNPRVSISIKEYNARKVYVFGGVQKPGPYPLKENTTLLEILIAEAGGPKESVAGTITILRGYLSAARENVALAGQPGQGPKLPEVGPEAATPGEGPEAAAPEEVMRATSAGAYETIRVDLAALVAPENGVPADVPLEDGDIINVPSPDAGVAEGERRVFVFGAVNNPGIFRIEGATFTALNAVLNAGGFTKFASENRVRLIREIDGQKVERTIRLGDVMRGQKDRDVLLEPEDTIVVPEGLF